jgi:hypothetical protein
VELAVFFAGFDDLAGAFVAFGRDTFFGWFLEPVLEFFFFAELAINFGSRPWLSWRERRLTKEHF